MGKLLMLGIALAALMTACDADEPVPAPPTRPSPSANDYTPATSGRATSENFAIDFAVSAMPSGQVAASESFQIELGGTQ